jgi:hypothetical protein
MKNKVAFKTDVYVCISDKLVLQGAEIPKYTFYNLTAISTEFWFLYFTTVFEFIQSESALVCELIIHHSFCLLRFSD